MDGDEDGHDDQGMNKKIITEFSAFRFRFKV